MSTSTMTAYLGRYRNHPYACEVIDMGNGAGQVTCFECDGDGDWTKYHPEPDTGPYPCVQCKGTGKQYISI